MPNLFEELAGCFLRVECVDRSITESELKNELQRIYQVRFSGQERYRNDVWRVLVSDFFSQWAATRGSVLDLGCGYCEFIRNVPAQERFGMDLNPSSRDRMPPGSRFLEQDCSSAWPLQENSLDLVFTSNFFEHLPTKAALQATLLQCYRCLKPGGYLIAIGPNVKFLSGEYWDFFDHHLALTEASLSEVLTMTGFTVERALAKFLPYTMSQGRRPPLWTVRLYLHLPMLWALLGRQFLVVGTKPSNPKTGVALD